MNERSKSVQKQASARYENIKSEKINLKSIPKWFYFLSDCYSCLRTYYKRTRESSLKNWNRNRASEWWRWKNNSWNFLDREKLLAFKNIYLKNRDFVINTRIDTQKMSIILQLVSPMFHIMHAHSLLITIESVIYYCDKNLK